MICNSKCSSDGTILNQMPGFTDISRVDDDFVSPLNVKSGAGVTVSELQAAVLARVIPRPKLLECALLLR